ncbi:MAG TPA: cupredoxin domain-containing protein [Terriglobales bacterium]
MKSKDILQMIALGALVIPAALYLDPLMVALDDVDTAKTEVVNVTAKRFAFDPPEITLKKGVPVTLHLTSADVAHGFFVRPLKIDADIPAGKSVDVAVTPQTAGKFTTICDRFCGAGHGNMHMVINVVE